jgi:predicted nucleotidyltransferase
MKGSRVQQDSIVEKIKTLATNCDDIQVLWLYGSRANGKCSEHSDYDLAVAFKSFDISVTERFLRPNELAIDWAMELGLASNMLSIVDINQAPVYLAFNIVEYGVPIYSDGSAREIKEQTRIFSQYEYQMIETTRNE